MIDFRGLDFNSVWLVCVLDSCFGIISLVVSLYQFGIAVYVIVYDLNSEAFIFGIPNHFLF